MAQRNDAPAPPSPIFRLRGLRKAFGSNQVLRGIDLDCPEGSATVVMGPSGCGKSVMLKHLIGLLKPDAGEVWFRKTRIDRLSERELGEVRRQVGFLFQQGALFDSMTVGENVAFPLREHTDLDRRARRERVLRVLRLVGLEEIIDAMPARLSGGQQKRIALARAIVLEPQAVLYDEPTTGLDPIRSDVINELILKLGRDLNITSIVVTHDLNSAFKVGRHMVMLHEGRVRFEGSPAALRASDDPIVRQFLAGQSDEAFDSSVSAGEPAPEIETVRQRKRTPREGEAAHNPKSSEAAPDHQPEKTAGHRPQ